MKRRQFLFVFVVLAMICAQFAAQPARAAGGAPLAFFDPNSTGWFSVRNMTGADHQAFFNSTAAQGYMMIDSERHEIDGQLRHSSVWQYNSDGRAWVSRSNLTSAQFSEYWQEYSDAGMRLIDQDAYPVNGEIRYAGIWMENVENLGWYSYRNQTSAEFSEQFAAKSRDGFMMVDVEAYQLDGQQRYSQIWVQNTTGLGWIERRNMTSQQYADYFDEYAAEGMRVFDLESYQIDGQQRYAAIWVENTNGRGWYAYRDMTAQQYSNRWFQLRDAGYRVIDFEVYETASGTRYAGVWRQNGDRPNWGLKDQVNRLGEQHLADNDVAGLSIAIAQGGKFVYLRGFGHADIALNREFHSGTIARLASSSKAVAGVLALELEEKGLIDIDQQTRDYAPSLPAHHSHDVWQTIANRSGVRHYNEGADVTKNVPTQYDTALEAAELFQDDPLNTTIGAYGYSTHAYTLLGAAMEGAVGDPLSTIIDEHLSDAYNVPTLQAEDRSQSNPLRATLYGGTDDGPVPVVPDNVSWKVLGGGLEVSAYDFARLGMKIMDGTILSEESRDRMWTPITNASDFALGWNTGVDQGTQVVARIGAQTGSRSYIRMYPEHEIVIVVLTNQRGHDTVQLGRDIGTLMLDELNSAANAETRQIIVAPPAPEAEEIVDPVAEFGVPSLGVPQPSLLPPTATDDSTEPDNEDAIGGQPTPDPDPTPENTLYLPLVLR
jgi:CubicO group peptidase (beta-lactamase class C family)